VVSRAAISAGVRIQTIVVSHRSASLAEALRLTADYLLRLHLVDSIVPEPLGGAHRNAAATIGAVGEVIGEVMAQLMSLDSLTLKARRREKYLAMGPDVVARFGQPGWQTSKIA
jgi:acetyl-CoA carboxylase carboxyl transferase subunit alpha